MEDRAKQTEAFIQLLDLVHATGQEREDALKGLDIFFDNGWPSNCFTLGMARAAGSGLMPAPFTGHIDEYHYKQLMKAAKIEVE
jgi:hypothetical protein